MYSYILMKLFGKSYLKYDGVCLICLIVMAVLCVSPVKVLEAQSFKNESVLNSGSWYKLGVTKDGIYRITYEDLLDMGIQPNTLNPKKISIYGNYPGMLPENNSEGCYDDLSEISIIVNGEDDGSFDENDCILFYGQNQVEWKFDYSRGGYCHQINFYSDTTYYFLNVESLEDGKRMPVISQEQIPAGNVVNEFLDLRYHENELDNYYKQGRRWFGESVSGVDGKTKTFDFVFRDVIADSTNFARFNFVGSSLNERFYARIKINDKVVFDSLRINQRVDHVFGYEVDVFGDFTLDSDTLSVTLDVLSQSDASTVYVDFFTFNVWRSLRYHGEPVLFPVYAGQFADAVTSVFVDDAYGDLTLFDVSNSMNPNVMEFSMLPGGLELRMSSVIDRRFLLVDSKDYLNVESVMKIDNQNLHSIDYAEMVIVAPTVFMSQAREIAAIHEQYDGLNSVVVDIEKVYNEFSTGTPDVSGLRNFLKMIYKRTDAFKYLLLFGRGNSDYKNILGYGVNFIPPYEAWDTYNEVISYVTDDYFGMFGENEGLDCDGDVEIGIGRIPAVDVEDADAAVRKIKRYIETSGYDNEMWRTSMMFVADDGARDYARTCDYMERNIDTLCPAMNIDKLYEDSYVRQKTSSGYIYPEATADLLESIENGKLIISYVGHGGVKGLTAEQLLLDSDIVKLSNFDKLTFMHTGTCEFSKFDDPTFISAGEKMFSNPNGGAIAMLTTTRPTQSSDNSILSRNFFTVLFKQNAIRDKCFGDFVRETKKICNSRPGYLCYVLLGDPALKFAYPSHDIEITSFNDAPVNELNVVKAMENVNIKGVVNDYDIHDVSFNGYVYVKMFDNKSNYSTLNNEGSGSHDYSCYKDVLFEGKATIIDGSFDISFNIPRSVNFQGNNARISFYAVDTVRDVMANGCFADLFVDGVADVNIDDSGPEIECEWTDMPDSGGTLSVAFYDPQGVMHYDSSIGRDVILIHESPSEVVYENLNSNFEPAADDFTRGSVNKTFTCLENGLHRFTVKAWDTHDNVSEKTIEVVVDAAVIKPRLARVINTPNPFNGDTYFEFDYNKTDVSFDVTIEIFDVIGRKVAKLEYPNLPSGTNSLYWDGNVEGGAQLNTGVYVYRFILKDVENNVWITNQRMMVVK